MPTRVNLSAQFIKALKRLSRKYPKVLDEVENLISHLEAGNTDGDRIQNLGDYKVYKVRLKNPDSKSGKVVVFA